MRIKNIIIGVLILTLNSQVLADTRYVDITNPTPTAPYTSWSTAATNIQDAVDEAVNGDTVLVVYGHYLLTSEIMVTDDITIQSFYGPESTIVDGQGRVRCFNLGSASCVVSGFTITNGYIATGAYPDNAGGGVYCTDLSPLIKDCILVDNYAIHGGGMYWGTANNCMFRGNSAAYMGGGMRYGQSYDCCFYGNAAGHHAGGMYNGTAVHCTFIGNSARLGGGMLNGVANNCTFSNNVAIAGGGGMEAGTANNCLFIANHALQAFGGGMAFGTANNCTIVQNTAMGNDTWVKGTGGGIAAGVANNCIVWGNSATYGGADLDDTLATNTCSPDVTHGVNGNINTPPLFVDETNANYRLSSSSPCVNAGNNSFVTYGVDLGGHPRILGGPVDMGAYEFGFQGCFITNVAQTGDQIVLQWTAFPSCKSVIYRADNLFAGFLPLEPAITYPLNTFTATVHSADNQYFYEVRLHPE